MSKGYNTPIERNVALLPDRISKFGDLTLSEGKRNLRFVICVELWSSPTSVVFSLEII